MCEEYRVIPGYEGYSVSKLGRVKSIKRNLILRQYLLDGYRIVDTFRGSLTETLPVHRAVALAWVENPDPDRFNLVNHKDGDKLNNWWRNLEWTNHSGNNYHAVNNNLRVDNIPCLVRDFATKKVFEFSSMAQAAEFMGLPKWASINKLYPKAFGRLVRGRYEFKFKGDVTEWFYENRFEKIKPCRFILIAKDSNGFEKELYSNASFLKEYQLYGAKSKSMHGLAEYANEIYPDITFVVRDSYTEERYRVESSTNSSIAVIVMAEKDEQTLEFKSLTQCAKHFNVDRSSIINRLNNDKDLDGWTFYT